VEFSERSLALTTKSPTSSVAVPFLADLAATVPTASHVATYAETVLEKSRQMMSRLTAPFR
jgi:hypothetical protein